VNAILMDIESLTIKSMEPAVREAICYHEAFRRLGFLPDDIWVGTNSTGQVTVELHAQGKVFTTIAGVCESAKDEQLFGVLWLKAMHLVIESTDEELQEIWESSFVKKNFIDFAKSMWEKGFEFPILAKKKMN